jgi:DNA-binding LacI/PurR family transcriptional regulator
MANIHDVARAAGVSISTVSYALSGKRPIADSTRLRVANAVRELGYRANAGARMLAGSRTNILALAAPLHADTHPPGLMAFVLAVTTAARSLDYDVLLLTADEAVDGLRRVASSSLVDGIILLDVSTDDERVPVIRELGLPAALIGIPHDTDGVSCVDLDFEAAAALAVSRLAGLGHTSVGLLGHTRQVYERGTNYAPRFLGSFLATGDQLGVQTGFQPTEPTPDGIAAAFDALVDELPGLSAVVLNFNENAHAMLLELLRARGVSVPGDLSIVSACSSFTTDHFVPPLDVIPLPAQLSGTRAVELVMEQLEGVFDPRIELIEPHYDPKGSAIARPQLRLREDTDE